MNISLHWLSDFLPGTLDAQVCADALISGGLPVENITRIGDDTVLDVEITSNRGDCLSHLGIARELSALLRLELRQPIITAPESSTPANSLTSVAIEAPDICPHYTARVLRNVKVGPSPQWMTRRLEAAGLRPINNIVDVTNYVMYELGQPLHAFDLDKLRDRRIVVRQARPGEVLRSIDGHERRLEPGMLVIADAVRPVALAGVMGGLDTEVSATTTNILLESARFDPLSVRRTSRALAMKSDSSYRFERRIDPTLPERASLRAAQLILQNAGGELLAGLASAGDAGWQPATPTLRLARLGRVLGVELPVAEVIDALKRLSLQPQLKDGIIHVTVPSWRLDLGIEADLIEEVARVIGYDKVPTRDEISIRIVPPEPQRQAIDTIRSTLVSAGHFEAVTFSFVTDALAGAFVPAEASSLLRADAVVRKADARLRPSILPGLLEAVRRNETLGTPDARLFEIGSTFWTDAAGKLDERRSLGIVGGADLHEIRGVIEAVLAALSGEGAVQVRPDVRAGFAREACGRIEWNGEPVGYLGRIDKAVAQKLDLRQAVCAAELDLPALLAGAQPVRRQRPLPRFPAVERDISFILPEATRYQALAELVQRLAPQDLEELRHVTTYRGKPLQAGVKSITINLVFRSATGTLTGEQVEAAVQKLVASAQSDLGATLRT
jgi:phenylalanyl-tRNA synthetase beta chain